MFVGLNPVLLELAVGGAHNDTLVLLILAGALALAARKTGMPPARAGGIAISTNLADLRATAALLVVGMGVKASAGLVLPFVVLAPAAWRERARVAAWACGALVLLAIVAVVGFGAHAFGFLDALGEQQQLDGNPQHAGRDRSSGWAQRRAVLVATRVPGRIRGRVGAHLVAHRTRGRMACDGRLGNPGVAALNRLAIALVCDMGAAAGRPRR